ncbi:MAG: hypothetical protein CVU39_04960 [Chloroflexi bacterium HGW-Chloroflexi-10]|nr:MAG: hypothetical protein CVU39_04960 [Chloroflexi bacterium HGW-Chloroflexi-10]
MFLFGWIVVMVTPAAWIFRVNPALNEWFNTVFAPEWVHIAAHLILFYVVGILSQLLLFQHLNPLRAFLYTLAMVFSIGLVQEFFQLLVKGRPIGPNEFFDLTVDLSACLLSFLTVLLLKLNKKNSSGQG